MWNFEKLKEYTGNKILNADGYYIPDKKEWRKYVFEIIDQIILWYLPYLYRWRPEENNYAYDYSGSVEKIGDFDDANYKDILVDYIQDCEDAIDYEWSAYCTVLSEMYTGNKVATYESGYGWHFITLFDVLRYDCLIYMLLSIMSGDRELNEDENDDLCAYSCFLEDEYIDCMHVLYKSRISIK